MTTSPQGLQGPAGTQSPFTPTTPHPDATRLAGFLDQLHQSGLGGLDPNVQIALAQGPIASPAIKDIITTVKKAASTVKDNIGHALSDPSLMVAPTTAQKIGWSLYNTGMPAVANQDIARTQQVLIDQGFAPGLKADGAWGPNWTAAMHAMTIAHQQKPGVGNTSAKDVALNLLSMGLPSHAIPLIKDTLGAILHSTLHALAVSAQPVVDIATGQEFFGNKNQPSLGDQVGAAIESFNRWTQHQGSVSPEEYLHTPVGMKDFIDVAGTALTLMSLGTGAGEVGLAAKGGITAAAKAGEGNVVKGLVSDMGAQAAAPKLTILNTLIPRTGEAVAGVTPRRFLFTRALENMPVLRSLSGPLDKIATAAGDTWQTTRQALATPYRLPVVGMAGDIGTQVMNTGLKLGAVGYGEKQFGDPNGAQAQVLTHLSPIAGPLGTMMDWATLGMHTPSYRPGSLPSLQIGQKVEAARVKLTDWLNQNDLLPEWERATGEKFANVVNDAHAAGIPNADTVVRLSIADNVQKFAANYAAQGIIDERTLKGVVMKDNEVKQLKQTLASQIINDPVKMDEALKSYMSTKGQFRLDLTKSMGESMANPKYSYRQDFVTKLKSDEVMRDIMPMADHIKTPYTIAQKAEAVGADQSTKLLAETKEQFHTADMERNLAQQRADAAGVTMGVKQATPALQKLSDDLGKATARRAKIARTLQSLAPKELAPLDLSDINDGAKLSSLGRARIDTQTVAMAQAKARQLGKELQKIDPKFDPESVITKGRDNAKAANFSPDRSYLAENTSPAEEAIRTKAFEYLNNELGLNTKEMYYYTTEDLLRTIDKQSHRLSADVIVPPDAPPSLLAKQQELKDLGYKLVYGTDIGHAFLQPAFDVRSLGNAQNAVARVASNIGLDFSRVDHSIAASTLNAEVSKTLQEYLNKQPLGTLPAWANAPRTMMYLRNVIEPEMNKVLAFQHGLAVDAGRFKKEIAAVKQATNDSKTIVKARVQDEITKSSGPADWTRKEVINALTKPSNMEMTLPSGQKLFGAGFTPEAAGTFFDALQGALRKTPNDVAGLHNPLSSLIQSNFALGGKTLPFTSIRIPNMTGSMRREFLKFRYQGSLSFAFKRIIKTGVKGLTEGVPFTSNATKTMEEMGTTARYAKLREKLLPHEALRDLEADEVEKMFAQNDIYNVYRPRDIQAYILGTLHDNALERAGGDASKVDNAEIVKKFEKVYSYGDRTAAEKSLNAIFFPFSFEKTVLRQVGGSILDSPAQKVMLNAAMNAYDSIDGAKSKKWMEDNLPLFKEFEKFNPFGHGIGLGQFGGIDRLYYDIGRNLFINMVGPKGVTNRNAAAALINLIPAFHDLNNLLIGVDTSTAKKPWNPGGELKDTLVTSAWELGNIANQLQNHFTHNIKDNPWQPQTHLTYDVQQNDGWNARTMLLTAYSKYLLANEHGAGYVFPEGTPEVAGEKINRQNINYIVNYVYPQWDPKKGQEIAATTKQEVAKERQVLIEKAPALLPYYKAFITNSDKIGGYLSKGSYDHNTAALAQATDTMRQIAIWLSYNDRSFYDFYRRYYQSKYGPLEMMR